MPRLILLAAFLAACNTPEATEAELLAGDILPPPSFSPLGAVVDGGTVSTDLSGLPPGARVFLLASPSGTGAGPCPAPLFGACLSLLAPAFPLGSTVISGAGTGTISVDLPDPIPADEVYFQLALVFNGRALLSPTFSRVVNDRDLDGIPDPVALAVVSDLAIPSAFFSDGGGSLGETFTVTEDTNCAQRAPGARGACFQINYNRDPDNNGVGPAFWGGFWLDPANDVNTPWEAGPAVSLGGTATYMEFYAWGENGGEVVNFKAGIGPDPNGGEINRDIVLTTTPTKYRIDVTDRQWTDVFGPFGYGVTDSAGLNNTPFIFYVDDIVYYDEAPPPLIVVSDVAVPSAYFSDGGGSLGETFTNTANTNCAVRAPGARGDCFEISYNRDPDNNGAGPAFWGGFWLDPMNDPNTGWELGPAVDLGGTANSVKFYAWGANGGEVINFKAGIGADANGGEINRDITLTTTPTQYVINVGSRNWTEILGVFGYGIGGGPLNNTPVTFYIDDIIWD